MSRFGRMPHAEVRRRRRRFRRPPREIRAARRAQLRLWPRGYEEGLVIDLFAGGRGATTGIEAALGRPVDIAVNHDEVAIATHTANHPDAKHYQESVWRVNPLDVTQGRRVSLLWASPDCTHFSIAKGAVPRSKKIRSLANVVVRWAREARPACIFVENVREFLTWGPLCKRTKKPIPERKGESFRRWVRGLENAGYDVEWRVLDASEYGAPTRRKRLFVIARCDGKPIVWPEPTHGPGRLPLHTAAECIDWSIPCVSIFEREAHGLPPLAEKTLWRIAQGIRRFVLESARPFVLKVNHGGREDRSESRGHAIVVPTLQQSGFGERPGQRARVPGLDVPLGTVVAGGQKHALVSAFLAKHFGDPRRKKGGGRVIGSELTAPIGTVTARDHHSHVAVSLAKFRGTHPSQPASAPVDEPLPTISPGGIHVGEIRAFLTTYYGSDGTGGQALDEPARTIRSKHCLGLVTVEGTEYQIVDICFRMLEPHELLRAQFGRFAASYDLSPARTKAGKVRLIGNSVCPEMVEALISANDVVPERIAA